MVDGSYILYNDKIKTPLLNKKSSLNKEKNKTNICTILYNYIFKKKEIITVDESNVYQDTENIDYDDIFKDVNY